MTDRASVSIETVRIDRIDQIDRVIERDPTTSIRRRHGCDDRARASAPVDGAPARETAGHRARHRRGRHVRARRGRGASRATRTGSTSALGDGLESLERRENGAETGADATSPSKRDADRSYIIVDGRPSRSRVGRRPAVTSVVASSRAPNATAAAAPTTPTKISIPPSTPAFVPLRREEMISIYLVHRPQTAETDRSRARRPPRLRRRRPDSSMTPASDATSATYRRPVLSSTAWPPARSSARNTSDTSHRMRISCFTLIARTRAR